MKTFNKNTKVLVVGSGFGGIASALRMRALGYEVTLLEKLENIGGRAQVFNVNGFRHDAGPTVITAPFMFDELFKLFGEDREKFLKFVPLDPWYRFYFHDGTTFDYCKSVKDTQKEIAKFSKKNINLKLIFLIIFLISLSFLIGERSNFVKFFLISIFLLFFVIKLSFKIKIFSSLIIFCILFLSLNYFQDIKYRFYKQQIENFQAETKELNKADSQNILIDTKNNIINFIKWTKYGAHYNAAYKIFLEHPYFGVGIKHFRNESIKEKYSNEEYKWTDERNTTHPHQIHFEFLSETGLFGYTIFIIFITASLYLSIKNYLIHKNLFQLVTILYVLVSILPLLPSGSFFSTYSSSLFWLNYTIMVSYIKKIKS